MGWTAPRTWVNGEINTASQFNVHIRDNFSVVKVTRAASGQLSALSSATLASLSAANLTGLARLSSGNTFTAGRTRFTGTSRCVIPVGADKYEDLGGGLRRGFWVEGDYLHHIASNQTTEWHYLGEYVSSPAGAVSGSAWIESNYLHYIDADGDERRCASAGVTGHSDAAAIGGSCWVETYVHWIRETGSLELPGHADIAHSDGSVHYDTHDDVAHSDSHSDVGHSDSHGDTHSDDHTDTHDDWHDDHGDEFTEPKHEDVHLDEHSDTHVDAHTDTHTDVAHSDFHSDSHSDYHDDHSDHSDIAAQNQPTVVP